MPMTKSGHRRASSIYLLYHCRMRLPWLLAILLAVVCGTLLVRIGDERRRDKDSLAKARDESAEFRGEFFKTQAALADVDKDRAAQAATLQQLATHVAQKAAADLDQQKLMDDLRKKLDAKEGDVSSGGGIVTVHLESEVLFASGEAELSKQGKEVLARVGDVLKPLKDKQNSSSAGTPTTHPSTPRVFPRIGNCRRRAPSTSSTFSPTPSVSIRRS